MTTIVLLCKSFSSVHLCSYLALKIYDLYSIHRRNAGVCLNQNENLKIKFWGSLKLS